jgi:2-methylcitrate dehydratase PrpD
MTTATATVPLTRLLAEAARGVSYESLPDDVVLLAKSCLLDWLGVTIAGAGDPLVQILREEAAEQGGRDQATLIGTGGRVPTGQAALINGAAGHALDFDDVQLTMNGHPSAPVLPALLALAEQRGATGRDFIAAFIAGFEIECRIGAAVMPGHYQTGWHATATLGSFGAAAACAHLLGLDPDQWGHALGIAGTEAAGLKSMFGTMCKPFHAGRAAQSGLLAATLAARGFTSNPQVLETPQGFAATQTDTWRPEPALAGLGESYAIRRVLFKYHAACYGTHAGIEALLSLRRAHNLTPEQVRTVHLRVPPGHLAMCNIAAPRTALEGKFSLRFTAALALGHDETGEAAFTDARVHDSALMTLRDRVTVEPDDSLRAMEAAVRVTLTDGQELRATANMDEPATDLTQQWQRLSTKALDLSRPVLGDSRAAELLSLVEHLEGTPSMSDIATTCAPPTL